MDQVAHNSLLGLKLPELALLVEEFEQPAYRARQLFEALYRQRVETLDQISTLPQDFRRRLAEKGISVGLPRIEKKFVSSDGTVRYLVACGDGQSVETVWMPEGDGGEAGDGSEAGRRAIKPRHRAAPGNGRLFVFPARWAARWIVSSA